jgi:hypothetical protein
MFDVVIPLGPNDIQNIDNQIECTKANVIGLRNIYIVTDTSCCANTIKYFTESVTTHMADPVIVIDESIFPFADQIAIYHGKNTRNGWYLQQLIKLYAGVTIPGILDRYLVIDADTYFLKPVEFINAHNQCQYNFGREYHCHYFDHMQKLHPDLTRVYELSGICHHMMFETRLVKKLFEMVQMYHQVDNKPFWTVFLEQVEPWLRHEYGSGASEYELYFNFICKFHLDEIEVRELQWENVRKLDLTLDLDYVSHHHFMRDE